MTENKNQNKNAPKKSLLTSLAAVAIAVLLIIGQQLGLLSDTEEATPTATPVAVLTEAPTEAPTAAPTAAPTNAPTAKPTAAPTATPTVKPTAAPTEAPTTAMAAAITEPQAIVNYLAAHDGKLPDNFLTKEEAQALGWDSTKNYLSDVAPGKSIGGDRFGNYEGLLPKASGRQYYEADCYYTKGKRNAYRLVYSNDGLYFYTEDHYQSFEELYPEQ